MAVLVSVASAAGAARRADLRRAIGALGLWSGLGGGEAAVSAATAQLRRAGDERTTVQARRLRPGLSAFGQTAWALSDQARLTVDGGYLDRQIGIVTMRRRRVAVAIAPADRSHETGTANLTRIARWVVANVDARSVARKPSCG